MDTVFERKKKYLDKKDKQDLDKKPSITETMIDKFKDGTSMGIIFILIISMLVFFASTKS